jgi:hypothetical protein
MKVEIRIALNIFLIINLAFAFSGLVSGQSDPLLRIELETKSDEATYKIAACGQSGFIMFYETTIVQDNYKFWIFILHNKFMQEVWKKDVPVYENMTYRRKTLQGDYLYLFFHDIDKKKKEAYSYQVLKINIINGRYELFSGNLPDDSRIVDLEVMGDYLIAGLDVEEDHTLIYCLNMLTKETKSVFELQTGSSRFENLYLDTLHQTYFGIFNVFASKTEYFLLLKEFDLFHNNINSINITPEENKKMNSGKLISVNEHERLLVGTYDFVKGSSEDKKNYFNNGSTGFYSVKISNNIQKESRYFNFLELENMTGYLKSKEYQAALKKAGKSESNPDKYSLDFDLLLHDIIQRDSLYYLVGEAYYEEYHTVTSTYYDYYGRPMPVTYSVFDGYKYFNAFISCFDSNGVKLWDNGMEIFNILTFDLMNRVNVYFNGEETILAYNHEGKIGAKIIEGTDIVEGLDYYPVESTFVNDKIMTDSKSNMEYWYDNYFLAYGFQTIKNNALTTSDKRVVFYINKVSFQ